MKGFGYLLLGSLGSMIAACAVEPADESTTRSDEADAEVGAEVGALEVRGTHRPFFVATFDHEPSAAEADAALASFAAEQAARAARGEIGALDHSPSSGSPGQQQKLVQINAKTSDLANAGTDNSKNFRFEASWFGPAGQDGFIERFILDNPGRADLNRNETSVFYYVINAARTSDIFFTGRLLSTSNDAWHCEAVRLTESNRLGGGRVNDLTVGKWIDANRNSGYLLYSSAQPLSYP